MKILLTAATLAILLFSPAFAQTDITINTDCAYLQDLLPGEYPRVAVQCGFKPGDTKALPPAVIYTALKRLALPMPELSASFTVIREGRLLADDELASRLTELYTAAHPDSSLEISSIRMGRDIYVQSGADYEISADTDKLGSATAAIVSGDLRVNFSYTVKMYRQGYVATNRITPSDDLESLCEYTLVDVTNLRTPLLTDIKGMMVKRTTVRGKPITTDMVELKPERVKGDIIRLVYKSNDFKIEISAIAEGNAVKGKTFPVKNPSSGKVFTALYQGNGVATVY